MGFVCLYFWGENGETKYDRFGLLSDLLGGVYLRLSVIPFLAGHWAAGKGIKTC